MRKNLRQVEKQNSTDLILNELETLLKGKEKSDETQVKIFYLQSEESEKNIELLFDTTAVGNSYLCDAFIDGEEESTLIRFKVLKTRASGSRKASESIIARRIKGTLKVNGEEVDKWVELKEDSNIVIGKSGQTFVPEKLQ